MIGNSGRFDNRTDHTFRLNISVAYNFRVDPIKKTISVSFSVESLFAKIHNRKQSWFFPIQKTQTNFFLLD